MAKAAARLKITGIVQGVGYRYYFYRRATDTGITGWVRNDYGGSVSAEVEGERDDIESLIRALRAGPSSAHVDDIQIEWKSYTGRYSSFDITR
ncbi:MAG: acylphosphatase [Candidatus Zixiibacteriota bacterium]|jgi:acylphosphatase